MEPVKNLQETVKIDCELVLVPVAVPTFVAPIISNENFILKYRFIGKKSGSSLRQC